MLKSLLTRIKSEKSETLSNQKHPEDEPHLEQTIVKPIASYQFKPLSQTSEVPCGISGIRYAFEADAPRIFNRILSCPISSFNALPYGKRKVKEIDLQVDPLPQYIKHLGNLLEKELPQFNHLLINVYPAGVGIMPHFDGPMYQSKVVVLSLGGPAIINFTGDYKGQNKVGSLLLEDQSIHIFEGAAYEKCLHGIPDYCIDSIFLRIGKGAGQEIDIVSASVSNFGLSRLYNIIKQVLTERQPESKQEEVDLSKAYGSRCHLLAIKDNSQFNYKVQLQRQERISITIRQRISSV